MTKQVTLPCGYKMTACYFDAGTVRVTDSYGVSQEMSDAAWETMVKKAKENGGK